jgi:hypothetical protein
VQGLNTYKNGTNENWTVPTNQDVLTKDQAKIKVVDMNYTTVYDESDAFMVRGKIQSVAPTADNLVLPITELTPITLPGHR